MTTRTMLEWEQFCVKNYHGGYAPENRAGYIYASGLILARLTREWGAWREGDVIADVGCGNGRLALGLIDKNIKHYYGIDVIKASIKFCKLALADDARFEFHLIDVRNTAYNPNGRIEPTETQYPIQSEMCDSVICNSLFSHTETREIARANLDELQRITKVGGTLFSTWRLVPPYQQVNSNARNTNYLRTHALEWLSDYGFEVVSEVTGLPREIKVNQDNSQIGFLAKRIR